LVLLFADILWNVVIKSDLLRTWGDRRGGGASVRRIYFRG
jgi:hypothetical protein